MSQVDLDLGNYERFLDITLTRDNNLTTGKVYQVSLCSRAPLQAADRWRATGVQHTVVVCDQHSM